MTEEIWKDIKGYEGKYQVSNIGRVKSLAREVENKGKFRKTKKIFLRGKILTPRTSKSKGLKTGYYRVALQQNGEFKNFCIHKLVAEAFIPNIENKKQVDHIDTDISNNKVENLRWCSQKENNNNIKTRKKLSISILKSKHKTSKYYYNGMTLHLYCSKNNLNYFNVLDKIRKNGKTIDEAVSFYK